MKKLLIFLTLLFCPAFIFATDISIIINEVAWMGTTASANDEWIELHNNTSSPITLDGWALKASDDSPNIKLAGVIPANDFYLLERTDDSTVPNIAADLIYTGSLGNSGEDLKLFDESNNLVDQANFSSGWIKGDNNTKQTMEKASVSWQTSKNANGTPKAQNSAGFSIKTEAVPPEQKTEEKPVTITYTTGVILNEILPSPEGADDQGEWIELFNQNNFDIDLSDWKIKDTNGSTTTYVFPKNKKITSKGYLILKRAETKITLNNTEDGLFFLTPDGKNIDSLTYKNAPREQSYNKTDSGWKWSTSLTPGSLNTVSLSSQKNSKDLSSLEKSDISNKELEPTGINSASLSNSIKEFTENKIAGKKNPWFLFFIALIITITSGIIILILKTKFQKIKKD